ncbi:Breast Cancer Type 2 Susceptibility Protein [Manis pentadactyla]|nr:Breast Cancer Type 2 Susceptibility Protein [Manis pentadactyla]
MRPQLTGAWSGGIHGKRRSEAGHAQSQRLRFLTCTQQTPLSAAESIQGGTAVTGTRPCVLLTSLGFMDRAAGGSSEYCRAQHRCRACC